MSIAFHRTDITQTSQAERGTMCVLPLSKGKRQNKIVLGDCDGVIQALGMRKKEEERNSVFKTNPGPNPITCLTLGATAEQGDKIFASSGNEVRGVNRKGKEFFKFTTNLTETIRNIHVEGVSIFAAGEYVANQYEDCADAHFFMSNDRVNDMSVAPVILPTELNPVLACRDRFVRVVQGSELYYEASVSGAATVAETCDENNRRRAAARRTRGSHGGHLGHGAGRRRATVPGRRTGDSRVGDRRRSRRRRRGDGGVRGVRSHRRRRQRRRRRSRERRVGGVQPRRERRAHARG